MFVPMNFLDLGDLTKPYFIVVYKKNGIYVLIYGNFGRTIIDLEKKLPIQLQNAW
jgi:hypothetical protein